jgi:hypothetical protein
VDEWAFVFSCSILLLVFAIMLLFKIEKNEMGGACGTYGAGERVVQDSGGET